MKSAEPSLPAATPSDPARCEVCQREKADPAASYLYRDVKSMNRICHRCSGDSWGREADCYRRGYERLLSAQKLALAMLGDAEVALCAHSQPIVPRSVIPQWLHPIRRALAATSAPQDIPQAEGRSVSENPPADPKVPHAE